MNSLISVCGLDCSKCEAREATITNNEELRINVANEWSKLNGVKITPEMINCEGCRQNGVKTPFCADLCEIRKCAIKNEYETCGSCSNIDYCNKIKMIIDSNIEAKNNLKK